MQVSTGNFVVAEF